MPVNPLKYETPDVQRDALFYELRTVPDTFLKCGTKETTEPDFFMGLEGVTRKKVPLGPGFENWTEEIWDFDLDVMLDQFVSGLTIKEGTFQYFTDFSAGGGVAVRVSARAKEVIEEIDPEYSQFAPMDLLERPSMAPVETPYFHWFIRRRRDYIRPPNFDFSKLVDTTARLGKDAQWEITNLPHIREWLVDVPFWCTPALGGIVYLRADAFQKMKAAGLVGLVEIMGRYSLSEEPWETVGHIF